MLDYMYNTKRSIYYVTLIWNIGELHYTFGPLNLNALFYSNML